MALSTATTANISPSNISVDSGFHPPPAAATVSASLPAVLDTSCSEEDVMAEVKKFKTIVECNSVSSNSTQASGSVKALATSSSTAGSQHHGRNNNKNQRNNNRRRRRPRRQQQQQVSGHCRCSSTYGHDFASRAAIVHELLEELMRLCNHEHERNGSYYHSISALLKMMQEMRGISAPSSSSNSRQHSAELVASVISTLPSPAIDPNVAYRLTRRIEVPENPAFNLIGRILGPRGMTLREMETRFKCRIYVRGEGSIRDPAKAAKLLDQPGWEHLRDTLHVFIIAGGDEEAEVEHRLSDAADFIERLLHPRGFDSFKRRQLVSLALLNGTFRRSPPQQSPRMNHHHGHHHQHSMQNQIGVH